MAEERMLTNKTIAATGNVHDEIFKACIGWGIDKDGNRVEASDIDIDKLYVEDEYAMFLFVRAISYGIDYDTKVECPTCQHETDISINLETDIDVKYAEEGLSPTMTVKLPKCGRAVVLRYPDKAATKSAETAIDVLPKLVESVEGVENFSIDMWMENELIAYDISEMRKAVQNVPFGADKKVQFTCGNSKCKKVGVQVEVDIPITPEFFRI